MRALLVLGLTASSAILEMGCSDQCGTARYNNPARKLSDRGQVINSYEVCGGIKGSFGADQGGGSLWIFLVPEFGNVVGAATWDIVAEAAVDLPAVKTFPLELTLEQGKLGGRGRWTDGQTTTFDVAVLQKGVVRFTSRSTNEFGDPVFHAKWDLEFGDPTKPETPSYVFHADDDLLILKGF